MKTVCILLVLLSTELFPQRILSNLYAEYITSYEGDFSVVFIPLKDDNRKGVLIQQYRLLNTLYEPVYSQIFRDFKSFVYLIIEGQFSISKEEAEKYHLRIIDIKPPSGIRPNLTDNEILKKYLWASNLKKYLIPIKDKAIENYLIYRLIKMWYVVSWAEYDGAWSVEYVTEAKY